MTQHVQKTPVEVRLTFNSTPSGPVGASIKITDRMSGKFIVDVDITGQELAELLGSRQVIAMADLPTIEHYSKVGMRAENYKLTDKDYPAEWPQQWRRDATYNKNSSYRYHTKPYHEVFGKEYIAEHGWDTYEWYYHNYGWDMIVRRHVEATDEEREARLDPHNW